MSKVSRRHILVVDDNPGVRETLAMLLMCAGYDVAVAEDGFAALSELRKTMPDVVISDLEMPHMSGFELLSVVRRRFPQILTVAMSGAYSEDGLPSWIAADGFYAKGGGPKNLLRKIEQLIISTPAPSGAHRQEIVPAWIPRNGNDSNGIPYVTVTCEECLRSFQLVVAEETILQVVEVPCRFCPVRNKYVIAPSVESRFEACA
ncbi:MAG TPA: response regulator [Terriglobales bacterium]|nr:response regulator [Terriglobales bacterium]